MTSSIFGVYHSKLQKTKWLPSNHLKFDVLLAACLIPTEMKFNRCTLVYIYTVRGCQCASPPPLQEILYPRLVFHPSKFRPPPPTWMAGYGPAGLHLPLLAGWGGGNDKLAIDKGGNLPEKVENHWYRQIA